MTMFHNKIKLHLEMARQRKRRRLRPIPSTVQEDVLCGTHYRLLWECPSCSTAQRNQAYNERALSAGNLVN